MAKSYDIPEVVVSLGPDGSVRSVEVPDGVTLTIDREDTEGYIETQVWEGPNSGDDIREDESENDHGHGG